VLALLLGSLGKIAFDVHADVGDPSFGEAARALYPRSRVELDDAAEAQSDLVRADPRGGEGVASAGGARARRPLVTDFERATGPWHAEWVALPEAFGYAAGALHQGPLSCSAG